MYVCNYRTKMGLKKAILQEIEEQQLRWYGQVMRMEDCKIVRHDAEWNPQGKRMRGRPVNTWKDGIRDSMQRRNLKDEECFDRELWRKEIMSLGWGKLCTTEKFSWYTLLYTHTHTRIYMYIVYGEFMQDFCHVPTKYLSVRRTHIPS
jgi:hypothetical protein